MKNADMPAMPYVVPGDVTMQPYEGLTKREMMAMAAMQGLLSGSNTNELVVGDERNIAETAVDYADALLAALEEKQ